jgi:hypothetical protein
MPAVMNMPKDFDAFEKNKELISDKSVRQLLNRFSYRYRLARSFKGMNAPEVGKTLEGYDAILKLLLAYTVYEVILKAANKLQVPNIGSMSDNQINDPKLVAQIRNNEKLKDFLLRSTTHRSVKLVLQAALTGEIDDIACIAFALRNFFAHGDLTPSVIGLEKKTEKKLLWDVSDAILSYCDGVFTKCVKSERLTAKSKDQ